MRHPANDAADAASQAAAFVRCRRWAAWLGLMAGGMSLAQSVQCQSLATSARNHWLAESQTLQHAEIRDGLAQPAACRPAGRPGLGAAAKPGALTPGTVDVGDRGIGSDVCMALVFQHRKELDGLRRGLAMRMEISRDTALSVRPRGGGRLLVQLSTQW